MFTRLSLQIAGGTRENLLDQYGAQQVTASASEGRIHGCRMRRFHPLSGRLGGPSDTELSQLNINAELHLRQNVLHETQVDPCVVIRFDVKSPCYKNVNKPQNNSNKN